MENGKLKIEKGDAVSLPNGWESNQLGDVCNVQRGLTYSGRDTVDISNNVVLRATNIHLDSSSLIFDELKYLSDDFEIKETYKLRKGSLLICFSSGSKSHLGKVALIDKDYNYAFGGFIGQVTPTSKILSEYLFYSLISEKYKDYISKLTDGVNINNLKIKDLQAFPIPIPPLDEQKRIVAKLDELFALIENGKLKVENLLADAKELFQSQLNEIFSQKGDGWVEKKLGEVCEKTINIKWQEHEDEELNYIDLSAVSRTFLSVTDFNIVNAENAPSRAKKIVKTDDIIFATTRPTLKRVAKILDEHNNQLCSTGFVVLRRNTELIKSDIIFYFLQTDLYMDRMESIQRGTSYPAVTDKDVKETYLSYPNSLIEQKQIVNQLDELKSHTQALESKYQQELDALDELKKSILQKAFNGEL